MRRENLSLTKWWWWCRSCAAHCHTRGISAEAEAAGRGDTRGWPLNIGKTIAAGNTHTSLLGRCYVVNVFVSITDVFFQQRALLVGVRTTQPSARFIKGVLFLLVCVFGGPATCEVAIGGARRISMLLISHWFLSDHGPGWELRAPCPLSLTLPLQYYSGHN